MLQVGDIVCLTEDYPRDKPTRNYSVNTYKIISILDGNFFKVTSHSNFDFFTKSFSLGEDLPINYYNVKKERFYPTPVYRKEIKCRLPSWL